MPITNSNGDQVEDPYDLEIGAIPYITSFSPKGFPDIDSDTIRLCRNVRNALAHNKVVSYKDAKRVIAL